ncbi:MAG TPA: NAD(P)H-binding protein [Chitinophagaceae bacterium]|nr:NAD(P)H-binding protein [Chitinophagaceae bacterium]
MKRISILGAGWLGGPLALHLQEKGHQLKVSTTTAAKIDTFRQQGLEAVLYRTGDPEGSAALTQLLQETDILIITVPPGRSQQDAGAHYAAQIQGLIPFIEQAGIPELIFTSSTTVYLSLKGAVDEESSIQPVSDMDRQIFDIEQALLSHPSFNATILRLGALIGGERHPVRYIVQRPVVSEANNPVNMIHRDDIIRFTERIISTAIPNEIFNVVAPILQDRRSFYTQEAQQLGLSPLPLFTDNPDADQRRVIGAKIAQRYGIGYEWLGTNKQQ